MGKLYQMQDKIETEETKEEKKAPEFSKGKQLDKANFFELAEYRARISELQTKCDSIAQTHGIVSGQLNQLVEENKILLEKHGFNKDHPSFKYDKINLTISEFTQ